MERIGRGQTTVEIVLLLLEGSVSRMSLPAEAVGVAAAVVVVLGVVTGAVVVGGVEGGAPVSEVVGEALVVVAGLEDVAAALVVVPD